MAEGGDGRGAGNVPENVPAGLLMCCGDDSGAAGGTIGGTFPGHWREYPRDWDLLPEHALLGREALAVVERAIEQLPGLQRLVFTLRDGKIKEWSDFV